MSGLGTPSVSRNYFHVQITRKNGYVMYEMDLTEEKLHQMVEQYESNSGFLFRDEWIYPSRDIKKIGIRITTSDSRGILQDEREKVGFFRIKGTPENFVFEKGKSVTSDLITKDYDRPMQESNAPVIEADVKSNDIFIVHGHDDLSKFQLSRILERAGLRGRILHEEPNEGRTLIEKFESESIKVKYAFVLLTPDDLGRSKEDMAENKRARQNVILELGYFIGKLGRKNVCVLKKGEIELPSDILGILPYSFTDEVEEHQTEILRELAKAGYSVRLA